MPPKIVFSLEEDLTIKFLFSKTKEKISQESISKQFETEHRKISYRSLKLRFQSNLNIN